jgi:hypothetical protein
MNDSGSNSIRTAIGRVVSFANIILSVLDPDDLNASDQKRLTLFAYLFGGVHGAAKQEGLSPAQAHAVALSLFQRVFEMSATESTRVAHWCMEQTATGAAMNAAVHAGLEAFLRWLTDPNTKPETLLPSTLKNS